MPRFLPVAVTACLGVALAAAAIASPARAANVPVVNVSASSGQILNHATSADIGHTITLHPGIILHGPLYLAQSSVTVHFTAPGGTVLAPLTQPYCTTVRPQYEAKCRWPAFLTGMGGDTFYYWPVRVTIRSSRITPGRFWFDIAGVIVPSKQRSAPLLFLMNGKTPTYAPKPAPPTPTTAHPPTTTPPPAPSTTPPQPTPPTRVPTPPAPTPNPPAAQAVADAATLRPALAGAATALLVAALLLGYRAHRRRRSTTRP